MLAEAEVQAIRQGFVFTEFTDDRGWEIRGKFETLVCFRLFLPPTSLIDYFQATQALATYQF